MNNKTTYKDLFKHYLDCPQEIMEILLQYEDKMCDGMSYDDCAEMLAKVEQVGYTFDYYLDAEPFGLRPKGIELNQLEGFENKI